MPCESGCLCDGCCESARDFAFGHFGLDRSVATASGLEPPLVSRRGHWYSEPDARLDVYDQDGFLYAERAA